MPREKDFLGANDMDVFRRVNIRIQFRHVNFKNQSCVLGVYWAARYEKQSWILSGYEMYILELSVPGWWLEPSDTMQKEKESQD